MNPFKDKQLISKDEFFNILKNRFGLTIDKDTICKYIDTYPQNKEFYNYEYPKIFTCTWKDKTGHGWANIYGDFYKNHTIPKTELFKEFKTFIDTYTFKIGQYYYS